jgi:hypothetical protein
MNRASKRNFPTLLFFKKERDPKASLIGTEFVNLDAFCILQLNMYPVMDVEFCGEDDAHRIFIGWRLLWQSY